MFPTYVFGENKCYTILESFLNLRLYLNKFKIPGVIFFSKLGILPKREVALHTVVGKGIHMPYIHNPTQEQINKYHKIYVQELRSLFDRYRDRKSVV